MKHHSDRDPTFFLESLQSFSFCYVWTNSSRCLRHPAKTRPVFLASCKSGRSSATSSSRSVKNQHCPGQNAKCQNNRSRIRWAKQVPPPFWMAFGSDSKAEGFIEIQSPALWQLPQKSEDWNQDLAKGTTRTVSNFNRIFVSSNLTLLPAHQPRKQNKSTVSILCIFRMNVS